MPQVLHARPGITHDSLPAWAQLGQRTPGSYGGRLLERVSQMDGKISVALTGRDRMLGLLEKSGRWGDDGLERGPGRAYGWATVMSRARGIVGLTILSG